MRLLLFLATLTSGPSAKSSLAQDLDCPDGGRARVLRDGAFVGCWRRGERHGPHISRNVRTGQLVEKGHSFEGEKHGVWRTWFPNGNPAQVSSWEHGVQVGQQLQFSSRGHLEWIIPFEGGRRSGLARKYDANGNVVMEHTYREGEVAP